MDLSSCALKLKYDKKAVKCGFLCSISKCYEALLFSPEVW